MAGEPNARTIAARIGFDIGADLLALLSAGTCCCRDCDDRDPDDPATVATPLAAAVAEGSTSDRAHRG